MDISNFTCEELTMNSAMKLFVDGKNSSLTAEFLSTTHSLYSGEPSILIVNGWTSTFGYRSEDFLDESEETYDPQGDRFVVSSIKVNGTVYLERNADETYSFPAANSLMNTPEATILHGPETINGYLDGDLLRGVITSVHSRIGVDYCWYQNCKAIGNGPRCLVKIREPGDYSCTVGYKGNKLNSCTVSVHHGGIKSVCQEVPRSSPDNKLQSVSIATLFKSGKLVKSKKM